MTISLPEQQQVAVILRDALQEDGLSGANNASLLSLSCADQVPDDH
jgi:hypothetical protein